MAETRWTPGPWKAIGRAVYADRTEIVHRVKVENAEEAWATADLIASAPSLYVALERCERVFRSLADRGRYPEELLPGTEHFVGVQGFGFIVDALARARGEGADDG